MSGWVSLVLLAAALALGLVLVIRPRRAVGELIAAMLLVALAGYAWQGSPDLVGKPAAPRAEKSRPPNLFGDERRDWLEQVGVDAQALDAADGLIRSGAPDYAIGILRAALAQRPKSMMLWIGLGNALSLYADGAVTPPARHAFEEAARLAPGNPAPAYFLGLSLAEAGDLDGAGERWRALLAAAPADAPWAARVKQRLVALDRARGMS